MSEEDIGIKAFYFQKYINSIKYMNEQQQQKTIWKSACKEKT